MTRDLADAEKANKSEAAEIAALKARVDAHNHVSNVLISSRKRKGEMPETKEQKVVTSGAESRPTGAVPKRKRVEAPVNTPVNAISSGRGSWDPKKSKFTKKQASAKPKKPLPQNLVAWLRKDICPSTSTPTKPNTAAATSPSDTVDHAEGCKKLPLDPVGASPIPKASVVSDSQVSENSSDSTHFNNASSFEAKCLNEAIDREEVKSLLYRTDSSGDGAISRTADASEAEISKFYSNNEKLAAFGGKPLVTPAVAKTTPEAPTEVAEVAQSVPKMVEGVCVDDIGVFIPVEAETPADVRPQNVPLPDAAELREAKERSEAVWNSWIKNSSKHGTKRGMPRTFAEAHKKVIAAQTRYFDCLEGLSSLRLPESSDDSDAPLSPVNPQCPAVDALAPDAPFRHVAMDPPMMVEVGQVSGSLCGIMPLPKKLCVRADSKENCAPSTDVIGGDGFETTNGDQV